MKNARTTTREKGADAASTAARRRLSLLILLLVAAVFFGASAPLRRLWLSRLAEPELAARVAAHPEDADAVLLLAERYLRREAPARAESVLLRLLEKDPASTRAWLLRSRAELAQRKLGPAYASLNMVLPVLSGQEAAEARFRLALLLQRRGDEDRAEVELGRAVELAPDHRGARLALARIALAHLHYGRALEHLQVVVRREPRNVDALEALSQAYRGLGDLDRAEHSAREAAQAAPGSMTAWRALGLVLQARATDAALAEAERAFRRAIECDPGASDLHYSLGKVYFDRGDYRQAAESLRRSIQIHPLNRLAYPMLIQCCRRLGQDGEADRLSREYDKLNRMDLETAPLEYSIWAMPENTALRVRLARLYLRYGRPDLAVAQLDRVLELNPHQPEAVRLREKAVRELSSREG